MNGRNIHLNLAGLCLNIYAFAFGFQVSCYANFPDIIPGYYLSSGSSCLLSNPLILVSYSYLCVISAFARIIF